jgi:hypothetical protein
MAPNTNDHRLSGNSIATHRRVYPSTQASTLSGSRDRTSSVSSPQRSNSFPNGLKAGDLAETLRQVQVERAILQEIGKDSQPVKSQHFMVAGGPRIRRCISDGMCFIVRRRLLAFAGFVVWNLQRQLTTLWS